MDIPQPVKELNTWFRAMSSARNGTANDPLVTTNANSPYARMREDQEFFYGDVEGTGTQLDKKQLSFIDDKYKIPISTKLNYAIVEQIVSMLTGSKPYPRLIGSSDTTRDYAMMYEQLFNAFWYENQMNDKVRQATTEAYAAGLGWLHVRMDNFYSESTFNVIAEQVMWQEVYVDPTATKRDCSDMEIACIARPMLKTKAEKYYDIKITNTDQDMLQDWAGIVAENPVIDQTNIFMASDGDLHGKNDKWKTVWIREFYRKEITTVYIGSDGEVGVKKPVPTQIPNADKGQLGMQIEAMRQEGQGIVVKLAQTSGAASAIEENIDQPQDPMMALGAKAQAEEGFDELTQQAQQLGAQLKQAELQYAQMPDMLDAYELVTIGGEVVTVLSISKTRQKRVRRYLLIGNKMIETDIIPCDEIPLIPFTGNFYNSFNRCFSTTHYIKDVIKAMNKVWSLILYIVSIEASPKVLYPDGSLVDPDKIESKWSMPGVWIGYLPNQNLPNGGKPEVIQTNPLSPALQALLDMLVRLAEYITGIGPMVQGQNTSPMPDSFGGIQSMQTFGTQRVKLYARDIEQSMERFAYVVISYLQAHAPKDKVLEFFDDNGDKKELEILAGAEDTRFKVRVNMTSNLPTARAMASQILAIVSGQTKNEAVADLLTKAMLRYSDIPEADKIAADIDTVKMLNQQTMQLQEEVDNLTKEVSQMQQQAFQSELETTKLKATMEVEHAKDLKILAIEMADDKAELNYHGGSVGKDAATITADNLT